jgi:hypothetical protein
MTGLLSILRELSPCTVFLKAACLPAGPYSTSSRPLSHSASLHTSQQDLFPNIIASPKLGIQSFPLTISLTHYQHTLGIRYPLLAIPVPHSPLPSHSRSGTHLQRIFFPESLHDYNSPIKLPEDHFTSAYNTLLSAPAHIPGSGRTRGMSRILSTRTNVHTANISH